MAPLSRLAACASLLLVTLTAAPAAAQGVVPVVLDAQGLPDAAVKRLQRAVETSLKQLTAWTVTPSPSFKKDTPRRGCASPDCQRELVRATGAPAVLLLTFRAQGAGAAFDASLWVDGERAGGKQAEVELETPEAGFSAALEPLIPAWARRGWAGLRVDAPSGSLLKVDGRLVRREGDVLPVTAGVHQVDVVFPDGQAVLQRLEVPEGSRLRIDSAPPLSVSRESLPEGRPVLRYTSYGLFMTGALLVAGGFIAGSLSRQTGAGQSSCQGDSRACPTLDAALDKHRQAEAYARTGNVLFAVGGAVAGAGVAVFTFDVVQGRRESAQ
ncbi:MAG: hypothetical protein K1X89_22885 [Myxococcaceae bacterium]|nr:hypothetical protein [Myxococcaceae bacterium]